MKLSKALSVLLAVVVLVCAVPMLVLADATALTLNTPQTVIPGTETATLSFTPATSGLYEWHVVEADLNSPAQPMVELFDSSQTYVEGTAGGNDWRGNPESFLVYHLTAGEQYTLNVRDGSASTTGVVVTVKAVPAASALALNTSETVVPGRYMSYLSFTPTETGDYVFSSAAVVDADPFLRTFLDENGEALSLLDGNEDDYDEWEFYAAYTLTAGKTYTLVMSDYSETADGFAVTVAPYYGITEHPTAADPTLKVNRTDEVSAYQWYTIKIDTLAVTEDHIGQNWGGVYTAATDTWSAPSYDNGDGTYYYSFFTIPLQAGDVLKITSSDTLDAEQCWVRIFNELIPEVENGALVYTIPKSGEYGVDLATDGDNSTFTFQVTTGVLDKKIDGQTTATLTAYNKNESYACVATFENGIVLTSQRVKMEPVIVKQPTAADPSVDVAFAKDVKTYEWYTVKVGDLITDADVVNTMGGAAYADGVWSNESPVPAGVGLWGYDLFEISLKAGDVITVLCSDAMDPNMWYFTGQNMGMAEMVQKDKALVFTVSHDDVYSLGLATDGEKSTFSIFAGEVALDQKVADQTANALTAYEDGVTYACVITYTDGVVLTSDMFTATAETGAAIKQAQADKVAALINALPETITKADADAIAAAKEAYDALSDDLKALVSETVKAKLNAAVAAIEALNQVVEVPETPTDEPVDEPADIPPTGEHSFVWLWAVLVVMSGSAVMFTKQKAHN